MPDRGRCPPFLLLLWAAQRTATNVQRNSEGFVLLYTTGENSDTSGKNGNTSDENSTTSRENRDTSGENGHVSAEARA